MNWKRMNVDELTDCDYYLIIVGDRIVHAGWDALNNWFFWADRDSETIYRPKDVKYFCEITWPEGDK